jgi:hypothetical protein
MKYQKSDWAESGRSVFFESHSQTPPTLKMAQRLKSHDLQMQSENLAGSEMLEALGRDRSTRSGPAAAQQEALRSLGEGN